MLRLLKGLTIPNKQILLFLHVEKAKFSRLSLIIMNDSFVYLWNFRGKLVEKRRWNVLWSIEIFYPKFLCRKDIKLFIIIPLFLRSIGAKSFSITAYFYFEICEKNMSIKVLNYVWDVGREITKNEYLIDHIHKISFCILLLCFRSAFWLNISVYNYNTFYPKSDCNSTKSFKWFKRMNGNFNELIEFISILSR